MLCSCLKQREQFVPWKLGRILEKLGRRAQHRLSVTRVLLMLPATSIRVCKDFWPSSMGCRRWCSPLAVLSRVWTQRGLQWGRSRPTRDRTQYTAPGAFLTSLNAILPSVLTPYLYLSLQRYCPSFCYGPCNGHSTRHF